MNVVLPVIQALQTDSNVIVEVLAMTTASAVLTRHGVPHLRFKDLVRPEDAAAIETGRRLAAKLDSALVDADETAAYLGLCYADLVQREGGAEAERRYEANGRMSFLPLGPLRRVFDCCLPDLLVATNSPRAEQAAFLVAQERGIRSLCIVDLFGVDEISWIGQSGYATRICVLSDAVREFYMRSGKSASDVVVTGNPAFDQLERYYRKEAKSTQREIRGWSTEKVVLWASSPEPTLHPTTARAGDPTLPRRVDAALIAAARRHANWLIVIRPHPSEVLVATALPANVTISSKEEELEALLAAVDCVIVLASTVGMQAALLGGPVIQLTETIIVSAAPYVELGLAREVRTPDELEAAMVDILEKGWLPPTKLDPPGRACANVVAQITNLLC